MKSGLALLSATILLLSSAPSVGAPGAAQRATKQSSQMRPRANQGRIPKAPVARTDPAEQRRPERMPTGHVNEMPHVNHDQWFGHDAPNDARFHLDHPFAAGHFRHSGANYRYRVTRFDPALHRFWFPGGFYFEVAAWDWALCEDWCWDCGDDFVIYDDPDHPGWYLVYNVHTGVYVHAQYLGS